MKSSGLNFRSCAPRVLGCGAPVLQGLARLAAAPILPIFGNGLALVQPVYIDDLTGCLVEICRQRLFEKRTVEIGGPKY